MDKQSDNQEEKKVKNKDKKETDYFKLADIDIRFHWVLVIIAIILVFFISYSNQVSLYESLKRSFYAGAGFWILSEIIDYFLKKKD